MFNGKIKLIIFLVIIFLAYHYINHDKHDSSTKQNSKSTEPVEITLVKQKDMIHNISLAGSVESYNSVAIKSRVDGPINKVNFKEGQVVKKGDLLFELDARSFVELLDQANANLLRDKAQLSNAESLVARNVKLLKAGDVADQDYQTAVANRDSLKATVESDLAAIENAKLQIEYCQITSPMDGVAGELLVSEGNLVKAADTGAMVTINQVTPIYVKFAVPEKYLAKIKQSQNDSNIKISATINDSNITVKDGVISFIDNKIDSMTGTIAVKVIFDNNDELLWPGQFINVNLAIDEVKNALVIPAKAIQENNDGKYVFILSDDDSANIRPIETAFISGDEAVITKGLEVNDKIVISGQMRITPGDKVKTTTAGDTN